MNGERKIISRAEMAEQSRWARERGEVIIFTNGCFDILHMGHVLYLRQARALGDRLYIGVNADSSVSGLKGSDRPYNGELDRAGVLAALEDVSAVTIFDEPTATALVQEVEPDIYVKGGDYSSDPQSPGYPIEGDAAVRHGGRVRIIPFAAGYSTTGLIERIRASQ